MRNLSKKLAVLTLVTVLCGALAFPAMAYNYSGAWVPTDGDLNILVPDFSSAYDVYIYDFDAGIGDKINILPTGGLVSTVYFHKAGGTWYASTSSGGTDLNLGPTPEFGFLFGLNTSYNVTEITAGKIFAIAIGPETYVDIDSTPIPLPPTALLLGSGILGLVAWGWRRGRKED